MKPIQVTRASLPDFDEYLNEIKDLWVSHWITNMGAKHKKLEAELTRYLQVPHLTLFANGHLALESTLTGLGLTGEVITTPFTFASTTHAIVRCGLEPVFCDINADDFTIDTSRLESAITAKTSAIVAVHVYGNICDTDEIERIARQHNLKVIYDAAHAFGVTCNGRNIANYGDASIFSFHATKVFNTIEGGAVTFKDESLQKKLNYLKNFGISGQESVDAVGGNAKMNEFQAAMGICNLRHIDIEIQKRQTIFNQYYARLSGVQGINLPQLQPGLKSNYAYFPVLFDGFKSNRDQIYEQLKTENIFARKYFYPLTNSFKCYHGRFKAEHIPIARYVADRILTLPLYPDLACEDVERICDVILR
jgi:dTDP-4-amino-4,6-dideoxygalactose transaminase